MKHDEPDTHDPLDPLDDAEQAWISKLAEPEPELKRTEDAFTQSVLARYQAEQTAPLLAGRIGFAPRTYAAAAALLFATVAGWYLYSQNPTAPGDPSAPEAFTNSPTPAPIEDHAPQPEPLTPVATVDPSKIKLGKLIAQTRSTVTQPATALTDNVRLNPQALRIENLLDLIDTPLPNLKQWLAPLEPDDQQSRA